MAPVNEASDNGIQEKATASDSVLRLTVGPKDYYDGLFQSLPVSSETLKLTPLFLLLCSPLYPQSAALPACWDPATPRPLLIVGT